MYQRINEPLAQRLLIQHRVSPLADRGDDQIVNSL
jgi:hypothetical protein